MTRRFGLTPDPRVAVIGAGAAGMTCGRALAQAGARVTVYDKGRRPGGRVATRRAAGFAFDHGAQYFTMEADEPFAVAIREGAVAPWDGTIVALADGQTAAIDDERRRWVGVPGMSALARHLATDMDIRQGLSVISAGRAGDGWRLEIEGGSAGIEADIVAVAVPAPQAVALLAHAPHLASRAAAAAMAPCWSVLLGFETPLALPFDGAFVEDGALAWMARDRSKPGREGGDAWVLHAASGWSRDHLEADRPQVLEDLCRAFRAVIGTPTPHPAFAAAHRWRYARVERPLGEASLFDPELRIGACGDWCVAGKIEAAIRSGRDLATRIMDGSGAPAAARHTQHRR